MTPLGSPVTRLFMEAADLADRVQAAADKVPVVDLADRIAGIIDNLTRQFEDETSGLTPA